MNTVPLQWRHNGRDIVSNHQPYDCLPNRLFRRRSKKTSKLRVTGLCVGNSPGTGEFPHKWPVTRKMFLFDDVIMLIIWHILNTKLLLLPSNLYVLVVPSKQYWQAQPPGKAKARATIKKTLIQELQSKINPLNFILLCFCVYPGTKYFWIEFEFKITSI